MFFKYCIEVKYSMSDIPTTSTTLLRDVASDSQHVRWTEFVARYRPMMEAYMRERFPSVEADDVIQETLIAVCAALPSYRYAPDERGHFHNYLTGILRNKALRQLGANRRQAEIAEKVREGVPSDGMARSAVSPERSEPRKRSLEVCALPHPQQNGNSAQIAAAAWLGFANPKPCRTTSPTTKSTTATFCRS